MAKDFVEKKAKIIDKLRELRSQNRSIEEIYKYTTDIIVEEDEEEEEEVKMVEGSLVNTSMNTIESRNSNRRESMPVIVTNK